MTPEFQSRWNDLTVEQQAYAIARLSMQTKKASAKRAGVTEQTVQRWDHVEQLVKDMLAEKADGALAIMEAGLTRAAQMKVKALDDDAHPNVQQDAATYILNRFLGMPTQKAEVKADIKADIGLNVKQMTREELHALIERLTTSGTG